MRKRQTLVVFTLIMTLALFFSQNALAQDTLLPKSHTPGISVKVTASSKSVSPLNTVSWTVRSLNGKKLRATYRIVNENGQSLTEDVTTQKFLNTFTVHYTPVAEGNAMLSLNLFDAAGHHLPLITAMVNVRCEPGEVLYTATQEIAVPVRAKASPYAKQIGSVENGALVVLSGAITKGYCTVRTMQNGVLSKGYCSAYLLGRSERSLRYSLDDDYVGTGLKYIAHRGMEGLAPEHSIPAYELAGKAGCWAIDADISETQDQHFVCMHDTTVTRTTNGKGRVRKLTLAQIEAFTIDRGSNVAQYPNLKVPTLEVYLEICKKCGTVPRFDIKDVRDLPLFIETLRQAGVLDRCIIRCTYAKALEIRKMDPSCMLAVIVAGKTPDMGKIAMLGNVSVNVPARSLSAKVVDGAHELGMVVEGNLVDNAKLMPKAIALHADVIISGDLQFLLEEQQTA